MSPPCYLSPYNTPPSPSPIKLKTTVLNPAHIHDVLGVHTLTCESVWKRQGLWSMSRVSLAWSRNRTNKRNFFKMNWDRAKW